MGLEDLANNERVIREFENLSQSILKEEDVYMDDQDDDEEDVEDDEEDPLDELEKKLEKRIVTGVILDLLAYEEYYQEHESAFTPDMIDNPPGYFLINNF
ncbi:hypothetical protein TSUD_146570 [Trifolium subterraneum]|uniref:Uncharacterized protein n=1 Tax=Trifolium subterraneum TaxID=3900 RepID=A0A2Z6MSE1_TRISU|nr:hypothetical protein TSUD_146570 [Trifolium subterraneum]